MATYETGQVVTLSTTVMVDGVLTDPTSITLTTLDPDGTESNYPATKDAVGEYHVDLTPTLVGHYAWRWVSTGTAAGADEGEFDVLAAFARSGIIDLRADVKPHLRINPADLSFDVVLQGFIDAATTWANHWFGNTFQVPVGPEYYDGGDTTIMLRNAPVVDATLNVKEILGGVIWQLTEQPVGQWVDQFGYSLDDAENGIVTRRTLNSFAIEFAEGNGNVIVTYTSGRVTVPADIRMAALEDIRGLFQQTQLGGRPAFGGSNSSEDWKVPPLHLFPRLAALADSALKMPSIG